MTRHYLFYAPQLKLGLCEYCISIIEYVTANQGCTVKHISRYIGIGTSRVYELLAKLESRNILTCTKGGHNSRGWRVGRLYFTTIFAQDMING